MPLLFLFQKPLPFSSENLLFPQGFTLQPDYQTIINPTSTAAQVVTQAMEYVRSGCRNPPAQPVDWNNEYCSSGWAAGPCLTARARLFGRGQGSLGQGGFKKVRSENMGSQLLAFPRLKAFTFLFAMDLGPLPVRSPTRPYPELEQIGPSPHPGPTTTHCGSDFLINSVFSSHRGMQRDKALYLTWKPHRLSFPLRSSGKSFHRGLQFFILLENSSC